METDNDFISQPVNDLPPSIDFKKMVIAIFFQGLYDVIEVNGKDLLKTPGDTDHIWQEWIQLFNENGHAHLFEE